MVTPPMVTTALYFTEAFKGLSLTSASFSGVMAFPLRNIVKADEARRLPVPSTWRVNAEGTL